MDGDDWISWIITLTATTLEIKKHAPVGNSVLVQVLDGSSNWRKPTLAVPLAEWAYFLHHRAHVAVWHKVHHYVQSVLGAEHLLHSDAVWMAKILNDHHLPNVKDSQLSVIT